MENDELDIDQLSEQLKRAKTLVKLCRDKLTKTDEEIKKAPQRGIIERIRSESEQAKSEERINALRKNIP